MFFTDLATGFRCWIVRNSSLYFFHDDAGQVDLSLAEGVALMRYFIARAAESALAVSVSALTAVRVTRKAGPREVQAPAGGAGSAAPVPSPAARGPAGGPSGGGMAAGRTATAKSCGGGSAATAGSPESEATVGDDGVDVDFRTLAVSIAHDLARGGGFSLVGW